MFTPGTATSGTGSLGHIWSGSTYIDLNSSPATKFRVTTQSGTTDYPFASGTAAGYPSSIYYAYPVSVYGGSYGYMVSPSGNPQTLSIL